MPKKGKGGGRRGRPPISNYNLEDVDPFDETRGNAVKREFARRLQRALIDKNWHQSELARRAFGVGKDGHPKNRDSVSKYLGGNRLPLPLHLNAIAKALGLQASDLLPTDMLPAQGPPPFALRDIGGGRMSLHINRTLTRETAIKIMALLAAEDK